MKQEKCRYVASESLQNIKLAKTLLKDKEKYTEGIELFGQLLLDPCIQAQNKLKNKIFGLLTEFLC